MIHPADFFISHLEGLLADSIGLSKIVPVKTTIDIPDELFKKTKAAAALKGQTLREFVTAALEARLEVGNPPKSNPGWRSGFGMVEPKEVETVDRIIAGDLETADPSEWN